MRVRFAVRWSRSAISAEVGLNSVGEKVTSTSLVPLPIGMSVPRGRSSTGIVMRSGRGCSPCSRFQWAIIRAVVTMSWSFTVYGEPLGAVRDREFGQEEAVAAGDRSGVPGATRAGGVHTDGVFSGGSGASGERVGGAVGVLSSPP